MPHYTMDDVRKHSTIDDCWVVFNGVVCKLPREFIESHPGGMIIMDSAGRDATTTFNDNGHPDSARELMREFVIGDFKKE